MAAQKDMRSLIGLRKPKEKVAQLLARAEADAQRAELGIPIPERTMHMVFVGPPGTGKTEMSKVISQAYYGSGIVDNPEPVVVSGRDLVSSIMGGSAEKTTEWFDKARGGVLFIDEAYGMVNSPQDEYGIEALNQFVKLSLERRDDTVIVLAGYEDTLDYLNSFNPGVKSRFPTAVDFPPYTKKELGRIAKKKMAKQAKPADEHAEKQLRAFAGMVDDNARGVENLVTAVVGALEIRLAQQRRAGKPVTAKDLTTYTVDDVKQGARDLELL